jgi:hypothetical protein
VQMPPRNLKFHLQALAACASVFLFGIVAFLPQVQASNLATNPNALQIVQQFIYKPKPSELLLKPQAEENIKPEKPGKGAKN